VLGHFLDELDFREADGLFVFDELVKKLIVFLLTFEGKDTELSGETMTDRVLGDCGDWPGLAWQ
jgi:hypothetical protein